MIVLGKPVIEYFRFQTLLLVLTVGLGLLRLGLSLAEIPWPAGRAVTMTGLSVIAIVYLPVRARMLGFGGYGHLWGLFVVQLSVAGIISAAGILLAAGTGIPNAFELDAANPNIIFHALQHFPAAPIVAAPILWLPSCLIFWIARRVLSGPAPAV